jgi:predicted TIM-barrel fold metal-dependent hydrolase
MSAPNAAGTTLLPDPPAADRHFTVISVDDHLVEPPHVFEGRVPASLAARSPRVVETESGHEVWEWEGALYPQIALGATAGRPKELWNTDPVRFSEIRPGCYDATARVGDMDLDGVFASLNFASLVPGFAGGLFYRGTKDAELGHALVRAWNDWQYEEWLAVHPERFIGCGITWLGDVELAAAEVRRNAERGFKAVSFPEQPMDMGLPPLAGGYWEPLFDACEETQTVLCLHVGSSGWQPSSPGSPIAVPTVLFPIAAVRATTEWLFSGVPCRHPDLKIAMSEGGIAWVPMLLDRISYVLQHSGASTAAWEWPDHPIDVLRRNFHFCAIDFASGMDQREEIGIDRIMLETDYPHSDSSWPHTQALLAEALTGVPDDEVRKVTWENASRLFRHPVPAPLQMP